MTHECYECGKPIGPEQTFCTELLQWSEADCTLHFEEQIHFHTECHKIWVDDGAYAGHYTFVVGRG